MVKRGKDTGPLREIVVRIAAGDALEPHHQDHPLVGGYAGARECHIEPDWQLIYERTETELVLIRTGTHADLFGK